MPVTTMTWGGYTLPAIDAEGGLSVKAEQIGSRARALSGSLRADVITVKKTIRLRYSGLSATERGLIWTAYNACNASSATLVLPDSTSYTVIVDPNSFEETVNYAGGTVPEYDITIAFDEV